MCYGHEYKSIKGGVGFKSLIQIELADRLGEIFNMVNLYATNKISLPLPVLYQIADILNINIQELQHLIR